MMYNNNEWLVKMWYVYTMENYIALKNIVVMLFTET